jgi:uncharacterized protein (DUF2147 family)
MHLPEYTRISAIGATVAACLFLSVAVVNAQDTAKGVNGVWIDHTGQGAVEIGPCADRVCGRVVWLRNPTHKSKSGKLICGTQVLGELRQIAADAWESGWIYNPEDEEKFSAALKLAGPDRLIVTGYLGIKLLGETFTWQRTTAALERCAKAARPS